MRTKRTKKAQETIEKNKKQSDRQQNEKTRACIRKIGKLLNKRIKWDLNEAYQKGYIKKPYEFKMRAIEETANAYKACLGHYKIKNADILRKYCESVHNKALSTAVRDIDEYQERILEGFIEATRKTEDTRRVQEFMDKIDEQRRIH